MICFEAPNLLNHGKYLTSWSSTYLPIGNNGCHALKARYLIELFNQFPLSSSTRIGATSQVNIGKVFPSSLSTPSLSHTLKIFSVFGTISTYYNSSPTVSSLVLSSGISTLYWFPHVLAQEFFQILNNLISSVLWGI